MSITETLVDGVPTLFAHRSDGHVSGGLVFRVGWADENLPLRGLTHLVVHLALAGAVDDVHLHGDVHATYTQIRAQGTAESVAGVLSRVCGALAELPTHLVEEEKEAILVETEGRAPSSRLDALYRYGPRGHGLCAFGETGLPSLDGRLAQLWAAETFTRGNAVLWVSGDRLPDHLRLPLREGTHQPLPEVTTGPVTTPAWFAAPSADLLTATGVVPRTPAASVFTEVLGRTMREELCERARFSYTAGAASSVRDAHSAVVMVTADSLPGQRSAVAGGFVDALARVRWGELPEDRLTADARTVAAQVRRAAADHETVAARATNRILGIPYEEPDELAAAVAAVRADEVRACAESFADTALAGVGEPGLGWAGWAPVPRGSARAVDGRTYPGRGGHPASLVVADDGVSIVGDGTRATVLFEDLVLMTTYPDGARHLVGCDGVQVDVEPTLFALDGSAVSRIDAAVDLARVVRNPPRHHDDVPQPPRIPDGAEEAEEAEDRPARRGWRDRFTRAGRRSA